MSGIITNFRPTFLRATFAESCRVADEIKLVKRLPDALFLTVGNSRKISAKFKDEAAVDATRIAWGISVAVSTLRAMREASDSETATSENSHAFVISNRFLRDGERNYGIFNENRRADS